MADERTRLEAAARDARNARKTIETLRDEEVKAAKSAIHEAYSERMNAAWAVISAAETALRNHIDTTAAHPLEGKRVYRTRPITARWSSQIIGEERFDGIVEVRRSNTEMPGNKSYGLPKEGEAFVRQLKKDGTPGKSIISDEYGAKFPENWKLVEPASGIEARSDETALAGSAEGESLPEGDAQTPSRIDGLERSDV